MSSLLDDLTKSEPLKLLNTLSLISVWHRDNFGMVLRISHFVEELVYKDIENSQILLPTWSHFAVVLVHRYFMSIYDHETTNDVVRLTLASQIDRALTLAWLVKDHDLKGMIDEILEMIQFSLYDVHVPPARYKQGRLLEKFLRWIPELSWYQHCTTVRLYSYL